jgi:hypothetical protein
MPGESLSPVTAPVEPASSDYVDWVRARSRPVDAGTEPEAAESPKTKAIEIGSEDWVALAERLETVG